MGTVSNFPNRMPDGGNQEFAEALWDGLPNSVQLKFADPGNVDKFLEDVEEALEGVGLAVSNIEIGINPETSEVVINLATRFN